MEKPIIVAVLGSLLILLWSIFRWLSKPCKSPPSPTKLPIIGNLHQLGRLPHRNLQSLAKIHGPLMLLHFGSVPVLVVSSSEGAREIMKTHDLAFADRTTNKRFRRLVYDCKDVVLAPYGEHWRRMKSILVIELLSSKRVDSFSYIREEETAVFMSKIRESLGPVNLSKMFEELNNDIICRSAFGRKCSDSEDGREFLVVLVELIELIGGISIGEFVPWLSWIGRVSGVDKRIDRVAKVIDHILEGLIQEHLEKAKINGDNFLDIMLQIYKDNFTTVDIDSIKGVILDVFAGGTDTTSTTLEWAMTELLRHPEVMKKLQNEVREICKGKDDITNEDLDKMFYLKAVIKETLRHHPPLPLLVPRVARENVKLEGYNISAGTMVMINAWAIGMDPHCWDEPEKFRPERFLNSSIDFKGKHFEFTPFGSGRRGCPGIAFANATIEFVLANLMHKFDWKLPNGAQGKDLDMSEAPGILIHRGVPLLALASHIN